MQTTIKLIEEQEKKENNKSRQGFNEYIVGKHSYLERLNEAILDRLD